MLCTGVRCAPGARERDGRADRDGGDDEAAGRAGPHAGEARAGAAQPRERERVHERGASFPGSAGSTYCLSVLARDTLDAPSAWTAETCTAVPLDERSLNRSRGWTAGTGSAYYRSTYLRSSTYGAKLTRTGVVARQIALVATTCRTCGKVRVYWGTTLLRTISLYSATTVNRKLLTVTTFTSTRTGTLSIKVYSSGRKVIIDGLAVRRN